MPPAHVSCSVQRNGLSKSPAHGSGPLSWCLHCNLKQETDKLTVELGFGIAYLTIYRASERYPYLSGATLVIIVGATP